MAVATTPTNLGADSETIRNHAAFIWAVADLLRGDYKQSEYGKVILPLTVLRRLDCVLEPTKQAVLERTQQLSGQDRERRAACFRPLPGEQFYNTSPLTFTRLLDDPNHDRRQPARSTSLGFSEAARDVIDKFDFDAQIGRLDRANAAVPGRSPSSPRSTCIPTRSSNLEMGYLYEELIRKFSELSTRPPASTSRRARSSG